MTPLRLLLAPVLFSFLTASFAGAADPTPGANEPLPPNDFGNALIPDLLADPSIVEFNGVFYCYATTDGEGKHLSTSGLPVVWKSTDFLNWHFEGSIFPPGFTRSIGRRAARSFATALLPLPHARREAHRGDREVPRGPVPEPRNERTRLETDQSPGRRQHRRGGSHR